MTPLLFDDMALVALFHSHTYVDLLWHRARRGGVPVLFPAAATYDLQATDSEWDALVDSTDAWVSLLAPNVTVLPLTQANAPTAGRFSRDVVVGHVSVEARDADATIVTSRRLDYAAGLRVVEFRTF